jgi:signal transduction histidine kinase/DNA-binding response OmpR family regulator
MTVSIRVKVIFIISAMITSMTAASVIIGITLTRSNFIKTIGNDIRVSGVIAEHLVSEKIGHLRTDMRIVAEKCRGLDDEQIREVLQHEAITRGYAAIRLIDRDGKILSYGSGTPGHKLMESENARQVFKDEMVTNTMQYNDYDDFIMSFRLPLEDGRILLAALPGAVISNALSQFRIWDSGNIFVLDHEGVILANMKPDLVFGHFNYIKLVETNPEYRPMADVFSRMIRGETGVEEYSYEGATRICAYQPIKESGGWSLGVVCPVSENPLSRVVRTFVISGMVFLGMGILAALLAAGLISHPFEEMEELALVAESASEAKSNFLANMSHEMRTPLNAIIGFAELELGKEQERNSESPSSETRESLEKIYSSGVTLLGLINDILDISKIESGKFELVPVYYDMPSLLNDTVVLNTVRIGSKPIVFKLDIDENLPARLFGDELRVKQIFNNLLSNAFKYTKEGTVTLRIRCERDDAGVWMNCSVSDTGIGIRKEDTGKLFSDYYQVDTRSNRHIEGTGLGLAITKRIVNMMNGTISVESEYGKGTTFTVRFLQGFVGDAVIGKSLAEKLKGFRYTIARRDRNKQLVRVRIPYARVLVVDDVATNLDLARSIMKPYGMTVDCVGSGQAAIDRIRKKEPLYNAIFMDHMMPGMDGIEAVRIIRNNIDSEYARTIPVIALTANAIAGNAEMFLNSGFQAFLTKPIDIMEMDEAVNRWVRDKELEKKLGIDTESRIAETAPDANGEAAGGDEDKGSQSQVEELIRIIRVEGLDAEKGLERFGGDGKSYMESLRSYVVHTPALLEAAQIIGNLADYAVTVHGIKGSSYGISADAVGQRAEELEYAAKAGNFDFVKAKNDGFIGMAEQFIAELSGLLSALGESRQKPRRARPDPGLLAQIREAAEQYDMSGLDSAIEALEMYSYESDADLVLWLREQIDRSEFEEIAGLLLALEQETELFAEKKLA